MMLLLTILLGAPVPMPVDATGMCTAYTQGQDVAEGAFLVCVDVAYRADAFGVDPWFAAAMAHKETRFDPTRRGDGGFSLGVFQTSLLYHCNPPKGRNDRFRTARVRAASCNLTDEGLKTMVAIMGVPPSRRTKVLSRYKAGKLYVPESQRKLYHVAAEYKGGPKPNEAAHKSAWRVMKAVRDAKARYKRAKRASLREG
tara:strand:- start:5469 stop:6065 length:597 start_codon:yes stop_codon:yes gene_type:complete